MISRRVAVVAGVLQCLLCIIVFTCISLETTQQFNTAIMHKDEYTRRVKIRRRLSLTSDYCNAMKRPPPHLPSVPNLLDKSAIYAAHFPGSGDKLITKHLIENTTGLLVGEASSSPSLERMKAQHMDRTGFAKGQGEVVVVRTNYPHNSKLAAWDYDIHGALVVLRNPLTAIPSYFDQLYELNSHVPAGDSSVETTNQFIKWRDNQLSDQLLLWQRFVSFWMQKFDDDKRVFISYESLINEVSGPQETVRLTEFLQGSMRASAMSISPSNQSMIEESIKTFANMDEIYCIWKDMSTLATSHEGRLTHKDRPLTTENLVAISTMLLELINQWSNHHQLVSILSAYNDEVLNRYQLVLNEYQIQQTSG